jgi:hypothetical protein
MYGPGHEAQFRKEQSRLTDADWSVEEPEPLLGGSQSGGNGTWSAIWESPRVGRAVVSLDSESSEISGKPRGAEAKEAAYDQGPD